MKILCRMLFESEQEMTDFFTRRSTPVIPATPVIQKTPSPVVTIEPDKQEPAAAGEALCEECKCPFTPKRTDSKYCSKVCYQRAYMKTYTGKKLAEIRKKDPQPKPRPDIQIAR